MTLRIYADFNSGGSPGHGACWCLRYGTEMRPMDDFAAELRLKVGMPVTLFYQDASEEFEVSAILELNDDKWMALPDWNTMRRLRG
jgi:hypothetical protein